MRNKQKNGLVLLFVIAAALVAGGIIYAKMNKDAQSRAVAEARASAPEAVKEQVTVIKESLFPAIMKFAEQHGDQLPTSLADLNPYFPGSSTDMDDDHWQIKAQGKLTPLLSAKNVILAEQKNVPFDEPKLIIYTDGHVERKIAGEF